MPIRTGADYIKALQDGREIWNAGRRRVRHGMTPFGKPSQLYERLQSGEVDRMRQRLYSQYKDAAPAERMLKFVRATGD
jgi:aromatic ring hydroxylase